MAEVVDPCWPAFGQARPNPQPIPACSARRAKFRLERTPESTNPRASINSALGLQRARVRGIALRAEEVQGAERATRQLSFDPGDDRARPDLAAAAVVAAQIPHGGRGEGQDAGDEPRSPETEVPAGQTDQLALYGDGLDENAWQTRRQPCQTSLLDVLLEGEQPARVYAQVNRLLQSDGDTAGVESAGVVTLEYPSGVVATVDCSWSHPPEHPTSGGLTMTCVGDRAIVEFDAFPQLLDGFDLAQARPRWEPGGADLDQAMLEAFLEAARTGRQAQPDGQSGLRTLQIVLAAYHSLATGQPVALRSNELCT
ncbi:Gfo/Idh/MocA family oxidoreductase [Streptomyces lunaelactis]|uniref:Gfo/Idh/MocA family oxidoreductase n=2 Tax=Streptomyces lunaelactis TaxID=1535768 RepID=UPI001584DEBA|nr:hypothetical protein [Streptomyces lunaelactis]